jgi:hypothetical protein
VIPLGFFVQMLTIVTVKHNARCYLLNIFVLFDLIKIKHGGKPKTSERPKSPKHFFFGKFVSGKIVKIFLSARGHIIVIIAIPSTATRTTNKMNVKRKIFSLLSFQGRIVPLNSTFYTHKFGKRREYRIIYKNDNLILICSKLWWYCIREI